MFTDDSEHRKAILAAIIDSSEDAIISKDLNGIITSWNKSAERMFGYKEDEVIGKHVSLLIPLDRRSEEDMIISNLRAGNRIEHYQTVRLTKHGRELHISLTVSPIKNSKGIIVGASKIARDITRQKEDEEAIRKYTQQLEWLNSTGKAIAGEMDVENILQKVTDATTKLSGAAFGAFFYNKLDAKGETYMLYALSGAPREAFDKFGMPRNTEVFKMTFNGEGVLRSDNITKDPRYGKNAPHSGMPAGHLPVVSYMAIPVVLPSGIVIGGLFFGHPKEGVFREEHETLVTTIASQAATALEKAKLYEEVKLLNTKKDEFFGFASHELKTPLTTISGYLQLTEKEPSLAISLLPKIRKQVNRLTAIISDFLDVSKVQAGKLGFNFTKTSLSGVIKESVETVKQLSDKHTISYEIPKEDITVMADSQKLSQVLINVLTNAIKYSPAHSSVSLIAIRLADEIKISIQDNGIGIAARDMDKIFSRFYRVPGSSAKIEGMGIGLYISKEIIEGHHGRIWAESEGGKGSTFHIEFPIAQPQG
jgi:PAS domain S-box-containing protein